MQKVQPIGAPACDGDLVSAVSVEVAAVERDDPGPDRYLRPGRPCTIRPAPQHAHGRLIREDGDDLAEAVAIDVRRGDQRRMRSGLELMGRPEGSIRAAVTHDEAMQTRRAELIEQRLLDAERVHARRKLIQTEKELSEVIFEQAGGGQDFALIRSKGDHALFGKSTQAMKAQWKVPDNRPLADFAPTIVLKAKDFATEITIFNARQHQLGSEAAISREHITNNEAVRKTLLERGIRPETLPAAEDVKRTERRLLAEDKKSLKNPDALDH